MVSTSFFIDNQCKGFSQGRLSKGPYSEGSESYSPYQNPAELPESKTKHFETPKPIDKGDYYLAGKGRMINLLRLRDQIAVTGDAETIELAIDEALAVKGIYSKKDQEEKFDKAKVYSRTHIFS